MLLAPVSVCLCLVLARLLVVFTIKKTNEPTANTKTRTRKYIYRYKHKTTTSGSHDVCLICGRTEVNENATHKFTISAHSLVKCVPLFFSGLGFFPLSVDIVVVFLVKTCQFSIWVLQLVFKYVHMQANFSFADVIAAPSNDRPLRSWQATYGCI